MLIAAQSELMSPVAPLLFYAFAGLSVVGALGVVFSTQIVRMAVFLLFTLAGVAFLYFLLEAEFLAAIQLVVYVGGTLILIIFGVMLTSKNPFLKMTVPLSQRLIGWSIGAVVTLFMGMIGVGLLAGSSQGFIGDETLAGTGSFDIADLGRSLLGEYMLPFEMAGVLLLVVMIGAAYLAKSRPGMEREGGPGA